MNDFITKPIDISALNALLIKYLSAQQQSAAEHLTSKD